MKPGIDFDARERIRTDLDTTLVVEAAAGTGKTSELIRRMVAVLTAGRGKLDATVAVTFTEAAAGELKLRLRSAIEEARQNEAASAVERERLRAALEQLEEARIATIHSFCADILRERPVEAGVDPMFEVAPDEIAARLFDRAFERWFETQLASPGEAVRRVLRRQSRDESPRAILRNAALTLAEWRDFPAAWRRDGGFDRLAAIDSLMDEMEALGEWSAAGDPDDYFTRSLAQLKRFVDEVKRREQVRDRDYDGLETEMMTFFVKRWKKEWTGYRRASRESFPKAELIERRTALCERLSQFKNAAGADLAPQLRDELWPVVEAYEELKAQAGRLDFMDLLLFARRLVRGNREVRAELQRRFTHIFVDEFQDTDPLQAEILMLLAADDPDQSDWRCIRPAPGKLFIVGDPKQSIYRFRRADVTLYETVKNQIIASGGRLIDLNVSFRSTPDIQEAVNSAFEPRMGGQSLIQARYVPLAPFRAWFDAQPAIVTLPVPGPYSDYGRLTNWKIEESLPDVIAAFVDWLVNESGWTITERERPEERVSIAPRHVCLLFRRFRHFRKDATRSYVRALEARHLPHLLVGGSSFHAREEVEAVRNALCAIERPEDELSVFATLRGPFFALSDAALLAYKDRCSTFHTFKKPPEDLPEALNEVADAIGVLRKLNRSRNRAPIAETIRRLIAATRAHAALAIWPNGEQALANVTRLIDMARRAERNGLISFRAFVDWLLEQAETGEAGDAPIIEEGTDGVRLMTVHKAKGLEFPVVILADMTTRETREPSRWLDLEKRLCAMRLAGYAPAELLDHSDEESQLEREEAARVLYVAATRARDLLVAPVIGDGPFEGWLQALNPVLYPPLERVRQPETIQPPGCPAMGPESVPFRPRKAKLERPPVAPGLHRPETGEHRVVWWDPSLLRLGVRESVGLTQQKLLAIDEDGRRSEASIAAHAAWQSDRARIREEAARPLIKVETATAFAERVPSPSDVESLEVIVESAGAFTRRPHGDRFGVLVHATLAVVDLAADRADVESAAELQGRLHNATPEEVAAAADVVLSALSHPLLKRAAAARGRCRRESSIAVTLEDGTIVEGVLDLAFLEARDGREEWMVVDFKTDLEIGERIDKYKRQVGLYAQAVARASGIGARGVLMKLR